MNSVSINVVATIGKLLMLAMPILTVQQPALAQPATQVYRIGFLSGGSAVTSDPRALGTFREVLRTLGWMEGQNLVIDSRYAEGQSDRLPGLAAELVRSKVDVIAAGGGTASMAARKVTDTIPIVMIAAGDPVKLGLIASLARPGGNVTGVAWDVGLEIFPKSLELLKEAVPKVRRVAVLSNPANPGQPQAISNLSTAADALRLQVQLFEAREPNELDSFFASVTKERAEAVFIIEDPMFRSQHARLAELTTKSKVPSIFGGREYVEAGGLMSYGPSLAAAFQRAAVFTDKILKGARPADLPVEQPTKFDLTINLRTAKMLGVAVPQSLLLRADQIIE
jgi:putative ABC transport system substrate-binding protein